MCVPPSHFLCRVADERIDDPLVDPLQRAIANERVSQHVPPSQNRPLGICQRALKMVMGLIPRDWLRVGPLLLAKRVLPAGMIGEPILNRLKKDLQHNCRKSFVFQRLISAGKRTRTSTGNKSH